MLNYKTKQLVKALFMITILIPLGFVITFNIPPLTDGKPQPPPGIIFVSDSYFLDAGMELPPKIDVLNLGDVKLKSSSQSRSPERWYAGSISVNYLPVLYADKLEVIIKTPSTQPPSDDYYYVLLSCWDDNSSYDQIGMCAYWGTWKLAWSRSWYTPDGELHFDYHPKERNLALNSYYKYKMQTFDNGKVTWTLYKKIGSRWYYQWSRTRTTGGDSFVITGWVWTGYQWAADFTDYEEVWYLNGDSPPPEGEVPTYDFRFDDTKVDGGFFVGWWPFPFFSGPAPVPPGIVVSIVGWPHYYVDINNPN
jgi:hypothetical protein